MKNCSTHINLSVPLFARAIYKGGTPTKSVKISTLYHNFPIYYCRDFSHILHIYTTPQVAYVSIRPGSVLIFKIHEIMH